MSVEGHKRADSHNRRAVVLSKQQQMGKASSSSKGQSPNLSSLTKTGQADGNNYQPVPQK